VKPLKVEFAAFGSYPGTVEVDFTALASRGLFVISGDTGTGKTTVFDAMSFALFGKMPLKPNGDIRSHHADASTKTYAQFTFEAGGAVYVARQTPTYERPSLKGGGTTTERRTVSLSRIDGDLVTTLATSVKDVTGYINDLIGLNAEQFQRVMVLPQGEVQRFLLDGSKDREELLLQLFGGDVFALITQELKTRSEAAAAKVRDTDEKINVQLGVAVQAITEAHEQLEAEPFDEAEQPDRETLGKQRTALNAPAGELQTQATALREKADRAKIEATKAAAAADRYDRAGQHRSRLKELADEAASVNAAAEAAAHSASARPVTDAAKRASATAAVEATAIGAAEAAFIELCRIGEQIDLTFPSPSPVDIATSIERAKSELMAHREALDQRDRAVEATASAADDLAGWERSVESNQGDMAKVKLEADGLREQLDARAGLPSDTAALDAECGLLEAALQNIRRRDGLLAECGDAEEAEREAALLVKETMVGYLQSEAPRMAAQLVAGEPCVVCGSTEHPQPAEVAGDGAVIRHEDVQRAQAQLEEARAKRSTLEADLAAVKATLGADAESDVDDVATRLGTAQQARAELAAALEERSELVAKLDVLETQLSSLGTEAAKLAGAEVGLRRSVEETTAIADAATAATAGIDASALDARAAAITELEEISGSHQTLVDDKAAATSSRAEADTALAKALAQSSFETVGDAQAVLLDEAAEQTALDAQREHQQETAEAKSALTTLEEQGVPESRPDAEALTSVANKADQEAKALEERQTYVQGALSRAGDALDEIDDIQRDSASLRERADAARKAHAVCHGRNDVNLLRWVLGQQLDQVTAVASAHLRQMSSGRYAIRRNDEEGGHGARGLDLRIDDAHTGRSREPRSLSGGEQFQASLALALGLADVVSRAGSARSHSPEALFIDEGFGSLDQNALDEAIGTLHGLQEQGRMVGVITHVEAMKERLHPGIVVERRPDGRGSELTVNP